MLEAKLRASLPNRFGQGIWLGDMIKMIREETDQTSPLFDKYEHLKDISDINDFSKQYHHAEAFNTHITDLNIDEVASFAKSTLIFITRI